MKKIANVENVKLEFVNWVFVNDGKVAVSSAAAAALHNG